MDAENRGDATASPIGGHWSHDVVRVEPRHTSRNQTPIRADHVNNVYLAPDGQGALITNGRRSDRRGALQVRLIPAGGNVLLDPPVLTFEFIGEGKATVTVESLLYAIYEITAGKEGSDVSAD